MPRSPQLPSPPAPPRPAQPSRVLRAVAWLALLSTLAWAGPLAAQASEYRLPPAIDWQQAAQALPEAIHGLPLSLEALSVSRLGDRHVLWIPLLMKEPSLPVDIESRTLDPMDWPNRRVSSREIGRRSLHFVEPGVTMLYAVMVDAQVLDPEQIGVGLVVVTRVDAERYDVRVESYGGEVLAAGRGLLRVLDPTIGMGTLIPDEDQGEVRRIYAPRWDLDPRTGGFPLFHGGPSPPRDDPVPSPLLSPWSTMTQPPQRLRRRDARTHTGSE